MDTAPLNVFARDVLTRDRITFADLRRLRRDVLSTKIGTHQEAEVLLRLDRIERQDEGWPGYLAETVAEFVTGSSPPPNIDPDLSAWLTKALPHARSTTAARIVRSILQRERQVDDALVAFASKGRRASDAPPPLPSEVLISAG